MALAGEMVDLASRKYPNARMAVHQDFAEALMDDGFQALQRKTSGVMDVGSCVESRVRARP